MTEAQIPFDAAVLALELAEQTPGRDPAVQAGREETIATFERLRAAPWLQRARQGKARST